MRLLCLDGDAILGTISNTVEFNTDVFEQIDDMWSIMTMYSGIGLAANQVGENNRIIVVDVDGFKQEIINFVLTRKFGKLQSTIEGCLSFPGDLVPITRNNKIKVRGFDRNWNPIRFNLRGLQARCVQHEIDHLNGITIYTGDMK